MGIEKLGDAGRGLQRVLSDLKGAALGGAQGDWFGSSVLAASRGDICAGHLYLLELSQAGSASSYGIKEAFLEGRQSDAQAAPEGYELLRVYEDAQSGFCGSLLLRATDNAYVFGCAGSKSLKDWAQNLDTWADGEWDGQFDYARRALEDAMVKAAQRELSRGAGRPARLVACGHSLGGALAVGALALSCGSGAAREMAQAGIRPYCVTRNGAGLPPSKAAWAAQKLMELGMSSAEALHVSASGDVVSSWGELPGYRMVLGEGFAQEAGKAARRAGAEGEKAAGALAGKAGVELPEFAKLALGWAGALAGKAKGYAQSAGMAVSSHRNEAIEEALAGSAAGKPKPGAARA